MTRSTSGTRPLLEHCPGCEKLAIACECSDADVIARLVELAVETPQSASRPSEMASAVTAPGRAACG